MITENLFTIDSNLELYATKGETLLILRSKHKELLNHTECIFKAVDYEPIYEIVQEFPIWIGEKEIDLNIWHSKSAIDSPNHGGPSPYFVDEDETYFVVTENFYDEKGDILTRDVKYKYDRYNQFFGQIRWYRDQLEKLYGNAMTKILSTNEDANNIRYKALVNYVNEMKKIMENPTLNVLTYHRKYCLFEESAMDIPSVKPIKKKK